MVFALAALAMLADVWEPPGKPFPHQHQFLDYAHTRQYAVMFGGLQSSKTTAGAMAVDSLIYGANPITLPPHLHGKMHPEVWVLSKSYALVDVAISTLRMWMRPDAFYTDAECRSQGLKRHDSRTWWLRPRENVPGDLPICLRARTASDPDAMRATPSLLLAWADECAHWAEKAWINLNARALVARTHFLVTTSPKGKNYLYRDLWLPFTENDPRIGALKCSSKDNPLADQEFLDRLRRRMGTQYAKQELDAEFVEDVGLVYHFDRDRHFKKRPFHTREGYERIVMSVDPGYGEAYAVVVLALHENVWWVVEEFKRQHCTTDTIEAWFRAACAFWKPEHIFVDKRRPTDISLLRKWFGSKARANREMFGETDRRTILPMIRYVQGMLEQQPPRLMVHNECDAVAEEFEAYHFPDRDDRSAGENPVKYMDDLLDATRYGICSVEHYMPIDQRVRYRTGADMMPKAGRKRGGKITLLAPAQARAEQLKKMEAAELHARGRRVRERVRRGR